MSANLERAFAAIRSEKSSCGPEEASRRLGQAVIEAAARAGADEVLFEAGEGRVDVRFRFDGEYRDELSFPEDEFPILDSTRALATAPAQQALTFFLQVREPYRSVHDVSVQGLPETHERERTRFETAVDGRTIQVRTSSRRQDGRRRLGLSVFDAGPSADLENLGLAPETMKTLLGLVDRTYGFLVVAGPSEGARSALLTGMLKRVGRRSEYFWSIEDPVGAVVPKINQSEVDHARGFTFVQGMREIARRDADGMMVQILSDKEAVDMAIRMATTGHLVLAGMDAPDAAGALRRQIELSSEPFLVASSVLGVVAARRLRKICAACAEAAPLSDAETVQAVNALSSDLTQAASELLRRPGAQFVRAKGCGECGGTGFKGRVLVSELLFPDNAFRKRIADKAADAELRAAALQSGFRPLALDALEKARAGLTTVAEAVRAAA
jgi:type IV pilus assembly protein PilB